jgi:hypothetical protein
MTTPPRIKIIRPGRYTSVEGTEVSFTLADLEAAAASYDRASDPAPMVIGHPALDAPAYGWAARLAVEDGHLVAEPDPETLHEDFAEAVRKGRYSKVSGRFYLPDSPGNPKPGQLYLKHIGFLGAAAPAVKGLGVVNLAAGEGEGVVSIDVNSQPSAAGGPNQEKDVTDKTKEASFAEREAALASREQELQQREAAADAKEKAAAAQIQTVLHAANVSFAEGLIGEGKLAPAGKPLLVGVLDQLESVKTVSFGEADGEMAPAAALKKLLSGAQPLVSFGELAKPEDKEKEKAPSFAAPPGYEADPARLAIHNKAKELQAADPKLSYADAVKRAGG